MLTDQKFFEEIIATKAGFLCDLRQDIVMADLLCSYKKDEKTPAYLVAFTYVDEATRRGNNGYNTFNNFWMLIFNKTAFDFPPSDEELKLFSEIEKICDLPEVRRKYLEIHNRDIFENFVSLTGIEIIEKKLEQTKEIHDLFTPIFEEMLRRGYSKNELEG